MFTRQQIELALDEGRLWALMGNGNYWVCRRNGATKLWKTRPSEFRIPLKAGFKTTGQLTHNDVVGAGKATRANFVITAGRE